MEEVTLYSLPQIKDERGNLSFVQNHQPVPFEIRRTYWIYDVPGGEGRGAHAYRKNKEFIIALSGSFDVVIDDGTTKRTYQLNRSYNGLYLPPGLWREIVNFSTNSVALELASEAYNPDDYIHDYDEYLKLRKDGII